MEGIPRAVLESTLVTPDPNQNFKSALASFSSGGGLQTVQLN